MPEYAHTDHLGTVQVVTTDAGLMRPQTYCTPYGEAMDTPAQASARPELDLGLTGHLRDKSTGLTYMQARYHDPTVGRFLSIDPVTFMEQPYPGQFNRYAYTWNDPINATDPDGEFVNFVVGGVIGGIIGAATGAATEITAAKICGKEISWSTVRKSAAIGGLSGAAAGATGVGAAKLAKDVGKLGKIAIGGGEIAANGVSAGAISAAGELATGGTLDDAKSAFIGGAVGGSAGTAVGKLVSGSAAGALDDAGIAIAESVNSLVEKGAGSGMLSKGLNSAALVTSPALAPTVMPEAMGAAMGETAGRTFCSAGDSMC